MIVELLHILVPVLGGAVIGYVTNAIAIRMIFRPFREYRIGPFRVPFTPGIIPKQRHQLAVSIARMVSKELLTEGAFQQRLDDPVFQERVCRKLSELSDRLLSQPLGTLFSSMPVPVREAGISLLRNLIRKGLLRREGDAPVRRALEQTLEALWKVPVPSDLTAFIRAHLRGCLQRVVERGMQRLGDPSAGTVTLGDILPGIGQVPRPILDFLYQRAWRFLIPLLQAPEVRRELELQGRFLLRDILSELNFFQRFLITAGQYDRTLEEKMPIIIDHLIKALERSGQEEALKDRIVDRVSAEIEKKSREPVVDILEQVGPEDRGALTSVLERALEGAAGWVLSQAEEGEGELTLGTWVSRIAGVQEGELTPVVLGAVQSWALSEKGEPRVSQDLLKRILRVPVDVFKDQSLRDLFSLTEPEKRRLDVFLTRTLFGIVKEKLPVILNELDIQGLVVKRIDELDVQEVEEILLSVISRHLRWINLMGAILGACIGALQLIARQVK